MPTAPITKPTLHKTGLPWVQQRAVLGDGTNTFTSQQFVKNLSGSLAKVASSDTVAYGLSLDPSHTSTDEPYSAPYGENHNPADILNTQFIVNITNATATIGSGSTTQSDIAIGSDYGIVVGTGSYSDIHFLNAADTTNKFFRVEERWAADATGDSNGRVVASVLPAVRQ